MNTNNNNPNNISVTYGSDYYLDPNGFIHDIQAFASHQTISSGFTNIDKKHGSLYPGLYTLGAVPALGKTTFAFQIADYLAASGHHVLYFALEQNKDELFAKSISRGLYLERLKTNDPSIPIYSSQDIRCGKGLGNSHVEAVIKQHASAIGNRLCIVNSLFRLTAEQIIELIKLYQVQTQCNPIVMIDYLQMIEPSMDGRRKMETREAIDHAVKVLKLYQKFNQLTMIVISALNRQYYLLPISYEAFKESGGIEYTADVVWGIQPHILSSEIFNKDGKVKEKHEMLHTAQKEVPRKIDLICVKTRFGSLYDCRFNYYSGSDYFEAID